MKKINGQVGLTFYVEDRLAKRLTKEAEKLRISRSDVIRGIIRLYYSTEVPRVAVSILPTAKGGVDVA